jgi:prepilin-type N-terminal cleavage/methylation domain-containing protein
LGPEGKQQKGTVVNATVPFVFCEIRKMIRSRGFTMTELIAVLLIMAVLAVSATSVFNRGAFDTAAFYDEARAQLAYGRKAAVAARRPVVVTVAGNAISLQMCTTLACGAVIDLASPQGEASFVRSPRAGSGITLGAAPATTFTFDALGATAATTTVTITGDIVRTVTIEAITGYVH